MTFYFLDSTFYPTAIAVEGGTKVGTTNCVNQNGGAGAYLSLRAVSYSRTFVDLKYRNTVYLGIDSYLTGPSMPVIYAIGFKESTAGTALDGVTCNKLHVDFNAPVAIASVRTAWNGSGTLKFR